MVFQGKLKTAKNKKYFLMPVCIISLFYRLLEICLFGVGAQSGLLFQVGPYLFKI